MRFLKNLLKYTAIFMMALTQIPTASLEATNILLLENERAEESLKFQLLNMTKGYLAFTIERGEKYKADFKEFGDKDVTSLNAHRQRENFKMHDANVASANDLVGYAERYCEGRLTGNALLHSLLEGRLSYLAQRKYRKSIGYIPGTSKRDLKILAQGDGDMRALYNRDLALSSITKYQMLSEMIYLVFRDSCRSGFSFETKELLQASSTLHSVLLGLSDDFSHPDAGIYTTGETPHILRYKLDCDYYNGCIVESLKKMMPSNWCYTMQSITPNTYYRDPPVHGDLKRDVDLDLPKLEWLDDVELYEKRFGQIREKPDLTPGAFFAPTKQTSKKKTKKKKPGSGIRHPVASSQGAVAETNDSLLESKILQDDHESPNERLMLMKPAELTKEKEERIQGEKGREEPQQLVLMKSDPSQFEAIQGEKGREEPQQLVLMKSDPSQFKVVEKKQNKAKRNDIIDLRYYVAPSGSRKFHDNVDYNQIFSGVNRYKTLGVGYQNIVDAIFASRLEKITFREFKSLWIHLNGEDSIVHSKSGGSHIKLLDKNGKYAGSTFAHGMNHQYVESTIIYLRDALIRVGVWAE